MAASDVRSRWDSSEFFTDAPKAAWACYSRRRGRDTNTGSSEYSWRVRTWRGATEAAFDVRSRRDSLQSSTDTPDASRPRYNRPYEP